MLFEISDIKNLGCSDYDVRFWCAKFIKDK